jgi:hypothetical protein
MLEVDLQRLHITRLHPDNLTNRPIWKVGELKVAYWVTCKIEVDNDFSLLPCPAIAASPDLTIWRCITFVGPLTTDKEIIRRSLLLMCAGSPAGWSGYERRLLVGKRA